LHLSSNFWPEITSTNAADHLHAGHARGRSRGWFGRNQFGNRETFFITAWKRTGQRLPRSKVSGGLMKPSGRIVRTTDWGFVVQGVLFWLLVVWLLAPLLGGGFYLIDYVLVRPRIDFKKYISFFQRSVSHDWNLDHPSFHVGHDRGGREVDARAGGEGMIVVHYQ
jgi:hypothetical protein